MAYGTAKYIKNYGIDTWQYTVQNELAKVIFNCITQQLLSFSRDILVGYFEAFKKNLSLRSITLHSMDVDVFDNPFKLVEEGDLNGAVQEAIRIIIEKFDMPFNDLLWVQASWPKSKDIFIQKSFLEWFLVTASLCSTTSNLRAIFKKQQNTQKNF